MELVSRFYFWNPFLFSLFTTSMNFSDQLVIVVFEPEIEG